MVLRGMCLATEDYQVGRDVKEKVGGVGLDILGCVDIFLGGFFCFALEGFGLVWFCFVWFGCFCVGVFFPSFRMVLIQDNSKQGLCNTKKQTAS